MLDLTHVTEVAQEIVRSMFPVLDLSVVPSVDSRGNDSLEVRIVVPGAGTPRPDGEALISLEGALRDRLEQEGDQRFAFVDVMTPEDLAADVDPES